MSHITVHRIDGLVRSRLGRTVQIEALQPFPERHVGNHWQLNRRPWAHPWTPGWAGARFDKDGLARNKLEAYAVAAGVDPETAELMPLDELLVLPAVQQQLQIGYTTETLWPIDTRASLTDEAALFEATGAGGSTSVAIASTDLLGTRTVSGGSIPRESYITGVSFSGISQVGDPWSASVRAGEIAILNGARFVGSGAGDGSQNQLNFSMRAFTRQGGPLILTASSTAPAAAGFGCTCIVTYELARRRAA